jgi:hypothetical protein
MDEVQLNILKSDIIDRIKNITNDSRAFLWIRSVYASDISDSELKIGGGNLLIAMGAFSAIDYLSKVNYCLSRPFGNLPKSGMIYAPVAPDCFVHFIKNSNLPVSLGIEEVPVAELKTFWDDWRNKLSHFNVQRNNHSAVSFMSTNDPNSKEWYLRFINGTSIQQNAFEEIATGWRCYIDILTRDLDSLAYYVANTVLPDSQAENILFLRQWLDSNLL